MINLDMSALKTFVVAEAEGSFSAAAYIVGCSQGAVSMRMKRLEQSLGGSLFKRNYHQLTLTDLGKTVLVDAKRLLAMQNLLLENTHPPSDIMHIRLGVAEGYTKPILSNLLSSLVSSHPQLKLDVVCEISIHLKERILRNELDLAVVTTAYPTIKSELLSRQKLIWVTSESFVVSRLSDVPLAVFPEGCPFRNRAIERLDLAGCEWRVVFSSSSGEAVNSAVSSGMAVTVMAENMVPKTLRPAPTEW